MDQNGPGVFCHMEDIMKKITLLDGSTGTALWNFAEREGIDKVPTWQYNITHPELVEELHRKYIEAGSQIILTNTFGANGPAVKHYKGFDTAEVIRRGVEIAKKAAEGTDVKVSASFGPLTMLLEPYGDLEEDECAEIYDEMAAAAVSGGADYINFETFMDVQMIRIAAQAAAKHGVPVGCSLSFERIGKTMMGNSVDDVLEELAPLNLYCVGLNCSLGPVDAIPVIQEYAQKTDIPIYFKPNAGLPVTGPDGKISNPYTAEQFAQEVKPALDFVSYAGGCCGTDFEYIAQLKKLIVS